MTAQARANNVTGSGTVVTGPCTYRGFWFNSAVTSQTVTIYDGVSATGTVLAQFTTPATGTASFGENVSDGIRCDIGIHVNVSSGVIAGSVRLG